MMKRILIMIILLALVGEFSQAQSPEGFNYQAVVRNSVGEIVSNQQVGVRISIIQSSITGSSVYTETFTPTSNVVGLINFRIGTGTIVSGSFANIDWAAGPYFVETAIDITGGSNFTVMGTSQLMSVPYALYAKTAGSGPIGPQGPTGPQGATGAQGPQGPAGPTGAQGAAGTSDGVVNSATLNGTTLTLGRTIGAALTTDLSSLGGNGGGGGDGKSAYQSWLDQGNSGTEADFIASLKGADGVAGTNGADGATGAQGPAGADGAQGPAGADGADGAQGAAGADGGGLLIYDAGNGAYVRASNTGVTFSKTNGVGTLTVPAGVVVSSIRIRGATSDLSSNQFDVVIDYADEDMNTDYASLFPPTLNVINSGAQSLGGPSTTFPFTYDQGSDPQRQIIDVANGNISVRIKNLNAFSQWIISLDL